MTYSILGYDRVNGDLGVAVQSKFPGVGSLVPYGEADVGVVATQAFGNPRHGTVGLRLLSCGATPHQAVDVLLRSDDHGARRQFALLDSSGDGAVHTGAELHEWDGWSGSARGTVRRARETPRLPGSRRRDGHDVRGERGIAGRTADGCARRSRTRRRRPPRPTVCRAAGTAARRRLRLARRPAGEHLRLRPRAADRRIGAVLRPAPAVVLPQRTGESRADRAGPRPRAEDVDGGPWVLPGGAGRQLGPGSPGPTGPLPGRRELRQPDRQRRAVRSGGPRRSTPAIRTRHPRRISFSVPRPAGLCRQVPTCSAANAR